MKSLLVTFVIVALTVSLVACAKDSVDAAERGDVATDGNDDKSDPVVETEDIVPIQNDSAATLREKADPTASETEESKEEDTLPQAYKDRLSYCLGIVSGRRMKLDSLDLNVSSFAKGVRDGLSEDEPLMSQEEMDETVRTFIAQSQERLVEKNKKDGEMNKKDGAAFLAENRKKEGVVALPSGLQYKILTQGNGPCPKPTDNVTCNYRGTLINGMEFDKSPEGRPITFPLNRTQIHRVISGWTEGLQLMPVGSKWQLFIPGDLAYREAGSPPKIGPNATLIFEVELVGIEPSDKGR